MCQPESDHRGVVSNRSSARFLRQIRPCSAIHFLALAALLAVFGCGNNNSNPAAGKPTTKPRATTADPVKRPASGGQRVPQSSDPATNNAAAADPTPTREPEIVYRPSDMRVAHDDDKLAKAGIHKYASKRLILYTDIEPAAAESLPGLMDQAYDAWVAYFGPLPPDREKSEYQMTGYIMADKELFAEAGLLPEDLPDFNHGRHRGQEFWMNDQPTAHYREHLMLHEGTHCFMTAVPNSMMGFVWYMEGMAELFGTHFTAADGTTTFRVMPHDRELYPGLGRIRLIEDEVAEQGQRDLQTILDTRPIAFLKNDAYAWSWAVCEFLDSHPRYRDRFRNVGRQMAVKSLQTDLAEVFGNDWTDLREEWLLFAANLCHGYHTQRAAIEFRAGMPLTASNSPHVVEIAADRGWQSSGVLVEAGKTYLIRATGRFTLAQQPKPWVSEPQGISFRYHAGRPLGMLLGTIRSTQPPAKEPRTTMLDVIPVGRELEFEAPVTGTLYFRVNEFWNELADNTGAIRVELKPAP
jgi:hypothetical protein